MSDRRVKTLSVVISGALTLSATGAQAQTPPPSGGLEEIIVTASRREESLRSVPISVAAFTQESLDKQNVRRFEDIAKLTPGVSLIRGARGNSQSGGVSIRGISSGAGTATVGIYIDETPLQTRPASTASSNPYPRIFDLERVEILRGPQGTLFGAGSEGGTVRFITPTPSLTQYSSYARSELAFTKNGDPSYELGGAIGGPMVEDKLGFRLSAFHRRDGGYTDRVNWNSGEVIDENSDWSDASAVRAALQWQPTDSFSVTPQLFYQKSRINDSSVFWEYFSKPGDNEFVNGNPIRTPTDDEFYLPSLKLEWDLGPATIISNSSYFERKNRNIYDSTTLDMASLALVTTTVPPPQLSDIYATGYLNDKTEIVTQEIRLQSNASDSRWSYVVGAFYQRSRQSNEYLVENTFLPRLIEYRVGFPLPVEAFFPGGFGLYQGRYVLFSQSHLQDEELSIFGQVDFKLTDKLKLTAGARYADNQYESWSFGAGPVLSTNGRITTSEQEDKPVTPKFGVSYQANEDNLLYATTSKGYRQGSTTGPAGSRCLPDLQALGLGLEPRTIKPDYVWSYEVGGKSRLLDGHLQLDGSVYQIDWKDIQSGFFLPSCNNPTTANFGTARSRGVDLQLSALVAEALTLGLSVGYNDSEYVSTTYGAGNAIMRSKGEPLPIAPWQLAASGQYDFDLFGQNAYFRADYQYASHNSHPLDLASAAVDPTLPRPPSSTNVDLRAGMRINGFDVSVFGTNLLNDNPEYSRYRDTPATTNYRGVSVRPLTFGVTIAYRY
jgi:iron complex outermembrane recepter protein